METVYAVDSARSEIEVTATSNVHNFTIKIPAISGTIVQGRRRMADRFESRYAKGRGRRFFAQPQTSSGFGQRRFSNCAL